LTVSARSRGKGEGEKDLAVPRRENCVFTRAEREYKDKSGFGENEEGLLQSSAEGGLVGKKNWRKMPSV